MIPKDHPRYQSLLLREKIVIAHQNGILAESGMIAHGRGEAFDYLIGEKTSAPAKKAIKAAAAALLVAENPVLSVNGNTAALASRNMVNLAKTIPAKIEINLFYRTPERVEAVKNVLEKSGAEEILGTEDEDLKHVDNIKSPRSTASPEGIFTADVVLVPLEDGDRAEILVNSGKKIITIDLNPLSRTAQKSSITIVDNIVRAIPLIKKETKKLKNEDPRILKKIIKEFDNKKNLDESLTIITPK
ncbi:4-phosphopantoate--beta-alanine ligase [Methanobacterium alcaliphilum]|uniref:4-phosphopantoate--beta-alanine ligase n=1 Tax=Methanobacterium alcaliphilum TaxID=392018 RepID=UPI00200B03E4|nr:4-phosphopantoate--beta-alanine ligase [Methanobacterium alcaliphilum]MCK9150638.1 phosphopantothenate/pantothenate synthetase [Methanobacterium alcaliphilum]